MNRLLTTIALVAMTCFASSVLADDVIDGAAKVKKDGVAKRDGVRDGAKRDGVRPVVRDGDQKKRRDANGKADARKRGKGNQMRGQGNPTEMIQRMLKTADKDKDGKISKAEAPERLKTRFDRIDANKDGFLDKKEQTLLIERLSQMMGQQRDKENAKGKEGEKKRQKRDRNRKVKDANADNVKPKRPPAE